MAVSRLKTWIAGETLTAADLNAEFNNILNNGQNVGFPRTGSSDFDANQLILDGDQDTHITADTDDRIDFSVGGFDGMRFDGTVASSVNGFDLATQSTGVAPEIKSRGEINIGMELRDSNGNEMLILGSTASAVNEFTVTNAATGNPPTLDSSGESNIGMQLRDSNDNELLILGSTASAVNEFTLTNTATGNAPILQSSGESNIGMTVSDSNGNQLLIFASTASAVNEFTITNQSTGVAPSIGSSGESDIGFELHDSNGNEVIIGAAIASAVNEFTITNAATGNNPAFAATGGDTNISINFVPKGTGTAQVAGSAFYPLQAGLATEQATTSGTEVDFTGIRSDARRITVMFDAVSTNGSSIPQIQIGDSGGFETSGYVGAANDTAGSASYSSGFLTAQDHGSSNTLHGSITLTLEDSTNNTWCCDGAMGLGNATFGYWTGGRKALSATLDSVRITTVNGTDAFDAGAVNILVE